MLLMHLCASRNSQLFFHTITEAPVARRAPTLVNALHVEGNELFKHYPFAAVLHRYKTLT